MHYKEGIGNANETFKISYVKIVLNLYFSYHNLYTEIRKSMLTPSNKLIKVISLSINNRKLLVFKVGSTILFTHLPLLLITILAYLASLYHPPPSSHMFQFTSRVTFLTESCQTYQNKL